MSISKGVTFGTLHSYKDWGLCLQPYTIPLPEPKTYYLDNSGGNGSIDLTEALGDINYNDRLITLTFAKIDRARQWEKIVSEIANAIHGQKLKVTFDNEIGYYYNARCRIVGLVPTGGLGVLTIEMVCEPYKYAVDETIVVVELELPFSTTFIECLRMPICPQINLTQPCKIEWDEQVLTLDVGIYTMPQFRLTKQRTEIIIRPVDQETQISTYEYCKFTYRQGSL